MNCVTCGKETTFYVHSVDHLIPICDKDCWNIYMGGGGSTIAPSSAPEPRPLGRNRTLPVAAVPPDEPIGSADETKRKENTNG